MDCQYEPKSNMRLPLPIDSMSILYIHTKLKQFSGMRHQVSKQLQVQIQRIHL